MNEPTKLPVDEFHGQGGSYVMENGVRRRAERTGPPQARASGEPVPPLAGSRAAKKSGTKAK